MNNPILINNPLALHKLTQMRKRPEDCPSREFVRLMREIGTVMGSEVMRELYSKKNYQMTNREIVLSQPKYAQGDDVPLRKGIFPALRKKPAIIPIIRGGLIMASAIQEVIGSNYAGHIGIYSGYPDQDTTVPSGYPNQDPTVPPAPALYLLAIPDSQDDNFPAHGSKDGEGAEKRDFFLVDPVVISGNTAELAIKVLKEKNVAEENICFISLLMTETATSTLVSQFPDVNFFTISADEKVENGILVDGFGNLSDRQFRMPF